MGEGIKAIETVYAQCRFRSRTEARWAVFFDALHIRWEYESEGFLLEHRITGGEGKWSYLPDFWLPEFSLWAEVKGTLTESEYRRLVDCAAALSSPFGGCNQKASGEGHDVLVLGSIPRAPGLPWRLHMHKGDLLASPWAGFGSNSPCAGISIADDAGGFRNGAMMRRNILKSAAPTDNLTMAAAYAAARGARFEHGESGAPRP